MKRKKWQAFFAGDLVIGESGPPRINTPELGECIASHEFSSCNFEAPLLPENAIPIPKIGPSLSQHRRAAGMLAGAGFSCVNLSNNHIMDYGPGALAHTLSHLAGFPAIGAGTTFGDAYRERVLRIGGVRLGLISCAEWGFGAADGTTPGGGFAWVNHPGFDNRITDLRKNADVCIVQVHAGAEEVDLPLPEWRARYRELIDLGADAVIGHHPHVPQGWELHAGKPIFYSLGNYRFDDPGRPDPADPWNRGMAVSLTFRGRDLDGIGIIPLKRTGDGIAPDHDPAAREHLRHLCVALEPENYERLLRAQILSLWERRYRAHYMEAVNGVCQAMPLSTGLKTIAKRLLGRCEYNPLFLLHNLKIETHRFCVERAMTLLAGG